MKLSHALLAAALLAPACTAAEDAVAPAAKTRKVLVVGWDGARSDAVLKANTPALDKLVSEGAYTFAASTQTKADAVSSPGWLSIFTGVQPDKHLVDSNEDFQEFDHAYPTFLRRAKTLLGLKTAAACDWEVLCSLILANERAYDVSKVGDEEEVTAAMVRWLGEEDYAVHYIHLDLPDHAGHGSGFDPANPAYLAAIEKSDALTARLVAAVAARPARAQEEWLIAVITDHGGEGTGHGPRNAANQTVFLVLAGDGVERGELPAGVTQMDLHPTVMQYLGAALDPAWKLDGRPVGLAE
jgi:predicted AlkP superfamily pyrophosphatase or phosphodiesterase